MEGARVMPCVHCCELFAIGPAAPESTCRRHSGSWAGFERGKLFGGASGEFRGERIVFHWDCCGANDERAAGCIVGPHEGYGGELGPAPRPDAGASGR